MGGMWGVGGTGEDGVLLLGMGTSRGCKVWDMEQGRVYELVLVWGMMGNWYGVCQIHVWRVEGRVECTLELMKGGCVVRVGGRMSLMPEKGLMYVWGGMMLKLEVGHNYLMDMGLRKDCAKVGVGSETWWVCDDGNSLVEVGYNVNDGMRCRLDGGRGRYEHWDSGFWMLWGAGRRKSEDCRGMYMGWTRRS